MGDEFEQEESGLGRRDFLRRSAIVGGMVWAAPVVQSIGAPAFAFTPNGEEIPPGTCDISNVVFLLDNDALRYKFEVDGQEENAGPNPCLGSFPDLQTAWCAATEGGSAQVTVNRTDPQLWIIDPAANYEVLWAIVFSGDCCYLIQGPGVKDEPLYVSCFGECVPKSAGEQCPA
jgi:hypothetical protein